MSWRLDIPRYLCSVLADAFLSKATSAYLPSFYDSLDTERGLQISMTIGYDNLAIGGTQGDRKARRVRDQRRLGHL